MTRDRGRRRLTRHRRPAETATGIVGALATLIAAVFGIDDRAVLLALPIVIGALPAFVTCVVELTRGRDA